MIIEVSGTDTLLKQTSVTWYWASQPSCHQPAVACDVGEIALGCATAYALNWCYAEVWPAEEVCEVGVLDRLLGRQRAGITRTATSADLDHLKQWAANHTGVEAFIEPRTMVTDTTVVLVAHDGEWTRRRVNGAPAARRLAKQLKIPIYDVALVGYPQRMRDYTARQRERD